MDLQFPLFACVQTIICAPHCVYVTQLNPEKTLNSISPCSFKKTHAHIHIYLLHPLICATSRGASIYRGWRTYELPGHIWSTHISSSSLWCGIPLVVHRHHTYNDMFGRDVFAQCVLCSLALYTTEQKRCSLSPPKKAICM